VFGTSVLYCVVVSERILPHFIRAPSALRAAPPLYHAYKYTTPLCKLELTDEYATPILSDPQATTLPPDIFGIVGLDGSDGADTIVVINGGREGLEGNDENVGIWNVQFNSILFGVPIRSKSAYDSIASVK